MAHIRHLAFRTEDPQKLAEFYRDVFGMQIIGTSGVFGDVWVTDGYLDIALIPADANDDRRGIDHFGITLDAGEKDAVYERLNQRGIRPAVRGPNRVYSEEAAHDVDGNRIDLTTEARRGLTAPKPA